ncbi:hypothetical protein [Streptomyces fodineus]|nr:hypothetical protein [Streptomyces fodineus]
MWPAHFSLIARLLGVSPWALDDHGPDLPGLCALGRVPNRLTAG